jgi:undecaprenyl-diphosphatase
MTLMPMVMGWPQDGLDPRLRKAFEVAVHAGAGLALAVDLRAEIAEEALHLDRRRLAVMALSLGPPALAGLALHGPIERRLGGPRSIAAGLIAGSIAMAAGERLNGSRSRGRTDARPLDGLALGAAQAAALLPGVSRSGATLAAARMRGFTRADSQTLCWHAALPVILGAGSLTGFRLAREGAPPGARAALGAGAAAAFWSTLASARLLRGRVSGPLLLAAGAYRCLLALFLIRRARAGAK